MLGLNWMKILQSADMSGQADDDGQKFDFDEMKKIEGYPVIIDGHMFSKTFDPNKPQAEASDDDGDSGGIPTSVGGLAGRFSSKLKKKAKEKIEKKEPSPDEYRQVLAYYSETESISFDEISDDRLTVPEGFKQKK